MKKKQRTTLPPLSAFSDIVRNARIDKGLSQEDAAKLLHIGIGVLRLLEIGPKHLPDPDLFWRLVDVLEIDPNDLLRAAGYIRDNDWTERGTRR